MTKKDNKKEEGLLNFFGDIQLVQKFKQLENPQQMIEFMWNAPVFQSFFKLDSQQSLKKSDGDSRRFREMGNKKFKVGNDEEAIQLFNKAIIKAPVSEAGIGKDLSLAVANRSAALFRLKLFNLALADIEYALAAGYPADLRYKLYERKIRILVLIQDKTSALKTQTSFLSALKDSTLEKDKKLKLQEEIKKMLEEHEQNIIMDFVREKDNTILAHKLQRSHPTLPCLSSDVNIDFAPSRGRFAVANRDIPTGSVILVEPAVVNIRKEEYAERFCDFCFKNIYLRLVPCNYCSDVAYCSRDCAKTAFDSYHKYECGYKDMFGSILDNVYKDKKDKTRNTKELVRLCYRAVAQKPLTWYKDNQDEIATGKVTTNNTKDFPKCPQLNMLNLVSHDDEMTIDKRLWIIISSACHLRTLQISGYFGSHKLKAPATLSEDEKYMGGLLVHVLQLIQFNTHGITESTDRIQVGKKPTMKDFEHWTRLVGNALYPTFALFNHSCDNNTYKYFAGNKVVVIASKNICKGEEITEGYFPSVQCMNRPERRAWLKDVFWFDCQCTPCMQNMPSLMEAPEHCQNFCPDVDVEKCKIEVEKIKEMLELLQKRMSTNEGERQSMETYAETTKCWCRLQRLVQHPCKMLYTAEQLFWKALRLSHGNMAAWN